MDKVDDLIDELIGNIIDANSTDCFMDLGEKYDNDILPLARRINNLRKCKIEKPDTSESE